MGVNPDAERYEGTLPSKDTEGLTDEDNDSLSWLMAKLGFGSLMLLFGYSLIESCIRNNIDFNQLTQIVSEEVKQLLP